MLGLCAVQAHGRDVIIDDAGLMPHSPLERGKVEDWISLVAGYKVQPGSAVGPAYEIPHTSDTCTLFHTARIEAHRTYSSLTTQRSIMKIQTFTQTFAAALLGLAGFGAQATQPVLNGASYTDVNSPTAEKVTLQSLTRP